MWSPQNKPDFYWLGNVPFIFLCSLAVLTENFEIQNFLGIYGSIYSRTPPKCSSPSYKTAWCYLHITYQHPPLYFESSLIGPTPGAHGWNVGWCVEVSPARQVESPVPELISVSWQGPREGVHPVVVDLPFWVLSPECKATAEKNRASWAVRKKGKFIRGKWEDDWPLRRTSVLLFRCGLSYTPPMKNSLKVCLIFSL